MALTGEHYAGDPGHLDDHNLIDAALQFIVGQGEGVSYNVVDTSHTLVEPLSGTLHHLKLTSATATLTFPTIRPGRSFTLLLEQGTGNNKVVWPSGVRWEDGLLPILTSTTGRIDTFAFVSSTGSYWLGFVSGKNFH